MPLLHPRPIFCLLLLFLSACAAEPDAQTSRPAAAPASPARQAETVLPGVDVLARNGFDILRGKRVGLLTHPAAVNRAGRSTIEILRAAPGVNLVALYGPEHGIYGDAAAGAYVPHKTDRATGLPVYSLYGKTRKPTPDMLAGIEVLVVDLQDIGTRSYTFTSALSKAMEACFEQGVDVVVLDRPNPLGGFKTGGPPLDAKWESYVGEFPGMPYVHGLTIGEIARAAKAESNWLNISDETRRKGHLIVVPMRGWSRDMQWPDTGLPWVATSPYIPDLAAVLGYPMTGLGGIVGGWSHGIGTPYPFRLLRYKGKSPHEIAAALHARNLSGLEFRPVRTTTTAGASVEGVFVIVNNWEVWNPAELNFHMMVLAAEWAQQAGQPNPFAVASRDKALARSFLIHVGSEDWWNELRTRGSNARLSRYLSNWKALDRGFQRRMQKYWLYR